MLLTRKMGSSIDTHEWRYYTLGMWLLIVGIILLVVAAVLHSYCAVGVKAKPVFSAAIFWSRKGRLLQTGWMILYIAGTVMLFFANWIVGIISIPIYWFVLPLLITPRMRRYYLGSWEENKDVLEEHGYNKDNYLDGDWWKR